MLVLLTTVTAVETLRVLFSVAYHAGETLGNVPSGLVVVAILATPVLVGPLRRVVPPPLLLGLAVGAAIIGRLALQVVSDVGYPLAGSAAAFSLAALALAVVSARRHAPSGSTGVAAALTVGLFVDVVLRATGTSWDIVWRTTPWPGGSPWPCSSGSSPRPPSPCGRERCPTRTTRGAGLSTFLLWPYLYLALVYTAEPGLPRLVRRGALRGRPRPRPAHRCCGRRGPPRRGPLGPPASGRGPGRGRCSPCSASWWPEAPARS